MVKKIWFFNDYFYCMNPSVKTTLFLNKKNVYFAFIIHLVNFIREPRRLTKIVFSEEEKNIFSVGMVIKKVFIKMRQAG